MSFDRAELYAAVNYIADTIKPIATELSNLNSKVEGLHGHLKELTTASRPNGFDRYLGKKVALVSWNGNHLCAVATSKQPREHPQWIICLKEPGAEAEESWIVPVKTEPGVYALVCNLSGYAEALRRYMATIQNPHQLSQIAEQLAGIEKNPSVLTLATYQYPKFYLNGVPSNSKSRFSIIENEDGTFSFMSLSNYSFLSAGDGTLSATDGTPRELMAVQYIGRSEKFRVLLL
mmetsp:Transcript_10214/g.16733  ORF Transcript_10214/g.16733 Transcript_10214/m.16733 type:complete len:233 (-) Transcript_10214:154-852(-)